MNKLVYLFELDSVRNSEEEIKKAQKAMYEEIVLNGNIVVMTMNQLSDSLGFLTAVNDNDTTQHILALFQAGVLRVSPFWQDERTLIETPSQYLQIHIDESLSNKANEFYFSGWSIKKGDCDFIRDIKSALQYNNPGLIGKSKNKAVFYFKNLNGKTVEEMKLKALEDIETFVRMILQMSGDTLAINPAKDFNSSRSMMEFLYDFEKKWKSQESSDLSQPSSNDVNDALKKIKKLRSVKCKKQKKNREEPPKKIIEKRKIKKAKKKVEIIKWNVNNRSDWYKAIRKSGDKSKTGQMTEAIIDLCYNYACEDSILGISRHYTKDTDNSSFYEDFLNRLHLYWKDGINGTHKFLENENKTDLNICKPENWAHISKIMLYSHTPQERGFIKDNSSGQKKGGLDNLRQRSPQNTTASISKEEYEKKLHQERFIWNLRILIAFFRIIAKICIYIFMFIIINMILNCLSKKSGFDNNGIIVSGLSIILFSLLSSIISLVFRIPDILDLFIQFVFMLYFSAVFLFKKICRFHKGGSSYCRISNKKELNQ